MASDSTPIGEAGGAPPVGTTFGAYDVRALLGAGGMGRVYRAFDPRLGRDVALKIIRRLTADDESVLDRLMREATLASALNHPNIVTIYETGVVAGDRYIAMELIEGSTLRQLSAQGLPLPRIIGIARQVAEALAVAHAAQIIHRDIKPDNVMVRPDGYAKLLDFGLARARPDQYGSGPTEGGKSSTEAGLILGTIGYMAPEQARGETVTAEADVFALGVVLYELVTGRHPFMAASQLGTLNALLWETPEPPSFLNPELPRAVDQLILESLQKDQRLRPGASEVMYRLALAHDSNIATALSAVTVAPRRLSGTSNVVGREDELAALNHEFERAHRGKARLVVISGEAGVGKTTLVDAFVSELEERGQPVRVGRGRCSERLAGSEAYLPVLEALESLQRHEQLGSLTRLIRALAPSWYAQLMPPTDNDSSAARLAAETAGGSQERLKREIASLLEEAGRLQPIVLWFDDVHWADPSTTDLLGYLARRLDNTRLLVITTARPSELRQARHPFLALKLDLLAHGFCREIAPSYLSEAAIERYIALQFPEHAFPPGFAGLIHDRTEGNALFMADVLRDMRRRQVIQQQDGRWTIAGDLLAIARELPESVRSLIQRKMDALEDSDRRLLAAASVQGMDFDSAIVAAAVQSDEEDVEARLERLEREHALVRFAGELEAPDRSLTLRYRFAHHMYQNACFDSLRATRKAALSRAIAERMAARDGDESDRLANIAVLFEVARDGVRAAEYLEPGGPGGRASVRARRVGAPGAARPGASLERAGQRSASGRRARTAHDLRPGNQDEQGLRRRRGRQVVRTRARAQPPGGRSVARHPSPHRDVGAPFGLGRDPHRPRHLARDDGALRAPRRPAPADDRRMVGWGRALPSRRARSRTPAPREGHDVVRPGVSRRARLADRHRARHLLPLRALPHHDIAGIPRHRARHRAGGRRRRRSARSSAAARVRAALRDVRASRPACAARGPAHLRAAGRRLPLARDRAGAVLGRAARRPGVHRAW